MSDGLLGKSLVLNYKSDFMREFSFNWMWKRSRRKTAVSYITSFVLLSNYTDSKADYTIRKTKTASNLHIRSFNWFQIKGLCLTACLFILYRGSKMLMSAIREILMLTFLFNVLRVLSFLPVFHFLASKCPDIHRQSWYFTMYLILYNKPRDIFLLLANSFSESCWILLVYDKYYCWFWMR